MVWAVVWSARAGDTVESAARTATATTVRLLRIMRVLPNGWMGSGARRLSWSSRSRRTPAPRQTTISEEAYAGEVADGLKAIHRARRVEIGSYSSPWTVRFVVRWLAGGSGRHGRGPGAGVATTTSATGAHDRWQAGRPGPRTGAGSRCRSTR